MLSGGIFGYKLCGDFRGEGFVKDFFGENIIQDFYLFVKRIILEVFMCLVYCYLSMVILNLVYIFVTKIKNKKKIDRYSLDVLLKRFL